jgi:hypothetical protein
MPECVFDASFIAYANGPLSNAKAGNLLHRRLCAIRTVTTGRSRVRYNRKLLQEYINHASARRNDVIDQFFELLDSARAICVLRSTLSRIDKVKADTCGWPTHDQLVLAAAVGGQQVTIHATEFAHGMCSKKIKRIFKFSINCVR